MDESSTKSGEHVFGEAENACQNETLVEQSKGKCLGDVTVFHQSIHDEVQIVEERAVLQIQSFLRGCLTRQKYPIRKNETRLHSPQCESPVGDFNNEIIREGEHCEMKSETLIKELYLENQNLQQALKGISDRLDSVLDTNKKIAEPSNQKDESQRVFRDLLQEETHRLKKEEKRKAKELKKALELLKKLQRKNKALEDETRGIDVDPKVLEDKDHELTVKLSSLEQENQSRRNVTKNQKYEYDSMRKASCESEMTLNEAREGLRQSKEEIKSMEKEKRSKQKKRPTKVNKKFIALKEENQFLRSEISRHKKSAGTGVRVVSRVELGMLKQDASRKAEIDKMRKHASQLDAISSNQQRRLNSLIEHASTELSQCANSTKQSKFQLNERDKEITLLEEGVKLLRMHNKLVNRRYESLSAPVSANRGSQS